MEARISWCKETALYFVVISEINIQYWRRIYPYCCRI